MKDIISDALKAVNAISVDSAKGLEIALSGVGALDPHLDAGTQRALIIQVVAPKLESHPAVCSYAYAKLHSPIEEFTKNFTGYVAPTICNLFLFQ